MGMSSRADWKVCAGAEAEEKAECTAFKAVSAIRFAVERSYAVFPKVFKKFDPAQ